MLILSKDKRIPLSFEVELEKKNIRDCKARGHPLSTDAASCQNCCTITLAEERRILLEKKQLLLEKKRLLELQENLPECRNCKNAIQPGSKSCPMCGARYPTLSEKSYLCFEILKCFSIVLVTLMLFAAAALLKDLI